MHHPEAWIWVLIPIAAIFAGTMRRWFQLKERQMDRMSHDAIDRAAMSAAETQALREKASVVLQSHHPDYIIDSVADLLPVIAAIEQRLAKGERPPQHIG